MIGDDFPAASRGRLADHAYNVLMQKIVPGEFGDGAPLPSESESCALFEISRPVIREALQQLREQGVVVSRRGVGSFVQTLPPENLSSTQVFSKQREMLEKLKFRMAFEPHGAALAAERRLEPEPGRHLGISRSCTGRGLGEDLRRSMKHVKVVLFALLLLSVYVVVRVGVSGIAHTLTLI